LKIKARMEPIVFELLPEKFTLTQLQKVYEAILDTSLDRRNFRKRLHKCALLWRSMRNQKVYHINPLNYSFLAGKFMSEQRKIDILSLSERFMSTLIKTPLLIALLLYVIHDSSVKEWN
jgi:hypothetical protein